MTDIEADPRWSRRAILRSDTVVSVRMVPAIFHLSCSLRSLNGFSSAIAQMPKRIPKGIEEVGIIDAG